MLSLVAHLIAATFIGVTQASEQVASRTGDHVMVVGSAATDFKRELSDLQGRGYLMTWVDAYTVNGGVFFNTVWQKSKNEIDWQFFYGNNAMDFDAKYKKYKQDGFRLKQVDTYVQGGQLYYTSLFYKDAAPNWRAYYGVGLAEHNRTFERYRADNYRLTVQSVIRHAGVTYVAAIYTDDASLDIFAVYNMDGAQLGPAVRQQEVKGRTMTYVNAYISDGRPLYSVIFTKPGASVWSFGFGSGETEFVADLKRRDNVASLITGYEVNRVAKYAAVWLQESAIWRPKRRGSSQGNGQTGGVGSTASIVTPFSIVLVLSLTFGESVSS